MQRRFNLAEGPIARFGWFNLGGRRPSQLLMVVHHLAVDGVSWRILLEDLQTVYEQLSRGEMAALGPKTSSFQRWARRLNEHALSGAVREESDYWLATAPPKNAHIPTDFSVGDNTGASARTVSVALEVEETLTLLRDVPSAYRTQINDILLAALGSALSRWTGSPLVHITLEGHGREELFDDVDLSRTVGWFTTTFPIRLDLRETNDPGDLIKSVKEQLRRVPNRGIGYGLLRYPRHR